MFKSFLSSSFSSNKGQNWSAYLPEVSPWKLHCTEVSGSNIVTILSLVHWIINTHPNYEIVVKLVFLKKIFSLSCLHITSACIAGHHDTNESPQPRRSAEKVNQSDFSFVLMNPLTKIQYSLSTLTNHYYYFLFMLGTIQFLGELSHLLPSPYFFFQRTFIIGQYLKKLTLYLCTLLFEYYFIYHIKRTLFKRI